MKRSLLPFLFSAASFALLPAGQAAVLSNNSNITTGVGNGFNGANTSVLTAPNTTFGFSDNSVGTSTLSLAEDFSLPSDSQVSSVVFFTYSTSTYPSPPTSPFTGGAVSLWNAQPGTVGASILATSTTLGATAWTGVYRAQSTTLTNAQRPVFSLTLSFANVPLTAGTYWASWDVTGIAAPGVATSVFNPPLMNSDGTLPTGNAIQSTDGGTTWVALADGGSLSTVRLPLVVNGTAVPEPSTFALVALLGLGLTTVTVVRQRSRA